MKVLCGYISLFSCFVFVVSATNSTCPKDAPSGCTCTKDYNDRLVVKCIDEAEITDIPSWLPNDTRILSLNNCSARTLDKDSFKELVNLTLLVINNQRHRLTFADGLVFQRLNNLLGINFEGNDIISLTPGLFANLPRLKYVILDNNPLNETFPDNLFENSINVKFLRFYNTRLSKDVLVKIGKGVFGKNITRVLMSGTPIEHLNNGLFSGLPKLYTFAAAGCQIKSIGGDILKGTRVLKLILDGNPIEYINENAFQESALTEFRCIGCQLTSNATFNGFLKKITLTKIELQNNRITFIPKDAFTNLRYVQIINLTSNSIETIEKNAFANLVFCSQGTRCIQIQDNPLKCDCNLAWLRSFVDKIEVGADKWKCAQPNRVAGKYFLSLEINEFCCGNTTSTRKCGLPDPNPNDAWSVSVHIAVAIISQIMVLFGIPLLLT